MTNVVIIGCGITGAYAAWFLSKSGLPVAVIDSPSVGPIASDVNPGGINPLHGPGIPGDMEAFFMHSYQLHASEAIQVAEESGMDFSYRRISRIELAFSEEDITRVKAMAPLYDKNDGFSARWLEPAELGEQSSLVSPEALGGLLMEGNCTVESTRYRNALLKAAAARGARLVNSHVTGIREGGDGYTISVNPGEDIQATHLVLACGPWVEEFAAVTGITGMVKPVKGQLFIATIAGNPLNHDITWNYNGIYHIEGSRYWVGGTREETGFDCSATTEGKQVLLDVVAKVIPGATLEIESHQAGLRPASPDGRPIVGAVPGHKNLLVATGGGSKGMLLSAGMGREIASIITDDSHTTAYPHLSPSRFREQ